MNGVRRASAILARIEDGIAGLVLAAVLGVVVYELTVRGIFGSSNLWTDELSRVLLIAMTYLSAIGLTRDGANVRVELFVDQLGPAPRRVFLGIGRMHLKPFAAYAQHAYLVRLVDAPRAPLPLLNAELIVARGPFDRASDRAMLKNFRANVVVAKNAGGEAASAKIEAARDLGLQVIMVRRPTISARETVESVAEVLRWLGQDKTPTERGV